MTTRIAIDNFTFLAADPPTTTYTLTFPFAPKGVIAIMVGPESVMNGGGSIVHSIGFYNDINQRCMAYHSVDGASPTNCDSALRNDRILQAVTSGPTDNGGVDASFSGNDVIFTIDQQSTQDYRVLVMAIGGAGIISVDTNHQAAPTTAGTQNITVANKPSVMFFLISQATVINTNTSQACACLGVAVVRPDGTIKQGVLAFRTRDNQTTHGASKYCTDVECLAKPTATSNTAVDTRARLTSVTATTATLTFDEVTATAFLYAWMSISGGEWDMGNMLTSTGTANIFAATPTMLAEGILFLSHCAAKSTTDAATADMLASFGMTDRSETGGGDALAMTSDQGSSGAEDAIYKTSAAGVYKKGNLADAVDAEMVCDNIVDGGFNCHMTDTEPTAASFVLWVAGGNAQPAATQTIRRRHHV